MNLRPEIVVDARAKHGECPSWDAARGVLYWVDIFGCALHVFDPRAGRDRVVCLDREICCAAPRRAGGVVAGMRGGFAFVDPNGGAVTMLANPETHLPGNRFNDGKCDPAGRFWAGTCAENCDVPGAGSLYCLDRDLSCRKALGGLTIANGMAWSADGRTLYYIDTPTLEIWAFDYAEDAGSICNRRTAVRVPKEEGYPDGMTIDAEGMLWVAHWGGSRVCRWDPRSGAKQGEIGFPAEHVSSCVFGGPDLADLYVTTSRLGLDAAALARQPLAGGLFRVRPGVRGTPTHVFAG
jgi:sugar lactone lactonase YvrE